MRQRFYSICTIPACCFVFFFACFFSLPAMAWSSDLGYIIWLMAFTSLFLCSSLVVVLYTPSSPRLSLRVFVFYPYRASLSAMT